MLLAQYHGWKYIYFSANTIVASLHPTFGMPWSADHIPDLTTKMTYPMTFYARIRNLYHYYRVGLPSDYFTESMEGLMKERFGLTSVPNFIDMERNASLVFYNSHHALDFARSLPPMFIPVGGMQCWSEIGALRKNIKEFIDNAEDGVVLISFGSTVIPSSMSKHLLAMFYSMMRKFNTVRFIWRWKGEEPDNAPKNLLAVDWLPQKDILSKFRMPVLRFSLRTDLFL